MTPQQVANTVIVASAIEAMVSVIEAEGGNDFESPDIDTVAQDAAAMLNAELGSSK